MFEPGPDIEVTEGERATGLDIPLLLTFANPIRESVGPHPVKVTQVRPWRASDGRSSLTLNLILTATTPHERRKIEIHNVRAAANGDTGEVIPDLKAYLAARAGRPDLLDYGSPPRR